MEAILSAFRLQLKLGISRPLFRYMLFGVFILCTQAQHVSGVIEEKYSSEALLQTCHTHKDSVQGLGPSRKDADDLELSGRSASCDAGTNDVFSVVSQQTLWEPLSNYVVPMTSFAFRHGITMDIVQHEQATVHFYQLPPNQDSIVATLLTKGHNSLLYGTEPQLHLRVFPLPSGQTTLQIEVGNSSVNGLPIAQWGLLSLLLLLVMIMAVPRIRDRWNSLKQCQKHKDPLWSASPGDADCGIEEDAPGGGLACLKVRTASRDRSSCEREQQDLYGCQRLAARCLPHSTDRSQSVAENINVNPTMNSAWPQTSDPYLAATLTSDCACPRHPMPSSVAVTSWSAPRLLSLSPRTLLAPTSLLTSGGRLRRLLLLSLTLAAATAVTVGMSSMRVEHSLHIGVPPSASIRKVRALSKHPDLSKLPATHSSFALVSKLQLLELTSSCRGNVSQCEVVAMCDVTDVDLLCRCRRGYYFSQRQCKECSTSCPDGYYMINPCTTHADAVCRPCTACGKTQYEAAPCTTTRDTICVDVTFPVGIMPMNLSLTKDDGTPISVSQSGNVFMERLINMKELETPMYVTNNQQTQDFVWHRESGVDIVVGISGVYLIPEYRELEVDDDTQYYRGNEMADQQTLTWFKKTTHSYCKHPVPDFYHLHLAVIRNRTAAAQVVRCDAQDKTVPRCPKGYKDGDRYLKWDINAPCDKFTRFFSQAGGPTAEAFPTLADSYNSIVCSEDSPMDVAIFQHPRPATLEMMFPSAECSLNSQQCQACLASGPCPKEGADQSCCGLSCYTQGGCHRFYSPACPTAHVECASGEIHRFTLMPAFTSMPHEFRCHLHYQRPKYLYNITYTLSVPALKFQVPAQSYTARVHSLHEHRHHADVFHFMHVWHDTRMPLEEQLLMRGNHRELEMSEFDHSQLFTVHSLKENREFVGRKGEFRPQPSGDSAYTTSIQFERPFLYSSSSWYKDGCKKNMSQIFPNQTLFRNDPMRVSVKRMGKEGEHSFQISHNDHSPYIKLSVKEGESVLRWFQGKAAHGKIVGDEISGSLSWDALMSLWSIRVRGALDVCPAILTLQVFSKMMTSCAGVFDILVVCPKNFTFTLNLSQADADLPDVFVLVLNDSVSSHRLVLSSVVNPVILTPSPWVAESPGSKAYTRDLSQWAGIVAALVLWGVGLATTFALYLHIKVKASKSPSPEPKVVNSNQAETAMLNNQPLIKANAKPARSTGPESMRRQRFLCLFTVLYVVYSLVFTFSLTLSVLYFMHRGILEPVVGVANLSRDLQRELNTSLAKVHAHEKEEEQRMLKGIEQRLAACSNHLQQQNRQFLQDYYQSVSHLLAHVFQQDGAIASLSSHSVLHNTSVYMEEIEQFVLDCNKTIDSLLQRFDAHFTNYAKELSRNGWLDFPREMFLTQDGDRPDKTYMPVNQLQKFLHWLQVDKVDELLGASAHMSSRLSEMKVPTPMAPMQWTFATFSDFASSLPPEPAVASHTFLVLDRPKGQESPPFPPTTTSTAGPNPQKAFLYSIEGSEKVAFLTGNKMKSGHLSPDSSAGPDDPQTQASGASPEPEEGHGNVMLYITLGVFLLLDILLIAVRMSWMVAQLTAARQGYEDRIPTDIVSQKILAIQTGYHVGDVQELYQSHSYSLENKENTVTEARTGSESEYNVYFCQSYPKSKDDILREIMAQKMNSTEQNLGQEPLPRHAHPAQHAGWGLQDIRALHKARALCHWLQRLFLSHLVWRFAVTAIVVVFVCVLVYSVDYWLTPENIRLLVGGQSALKDLRLQVHFSNSHLAGMTEHLAQVLEEHAATVQQEVSAASQLLATTIHTQRELLSSLLERVCAGAGTPVCNVTSYSSLPQPQLPTWQACNFLPPRPQLYEGSNTDNLDDLVLAQLSPLLVTVKSSVFSVAAVIISVLCVNFMCNAAACVVRYYMIISGLLPRVTIFQISEQTSMTYDADPNRPMQRSASWLESCESGVYVGEGELEANKDV